MVFFKRILPLIGFIWLIGGLIPINAAEVMDLDEENWRLMLNDEWMVEFYAPWCPACKNLAPIWTKFAKIAQKKGVHVAKVDVTQSPSLSGRFFVTALPTIYHVINGEFRQYRGSRDADSFLLFITQKQWEKIDSLSAWKQPDSIHMSLLSYFFKLSHYLKDINTKLHEEYGLPTWGAYGLFAVATILIGAILGLFLVCIVDFLYPPKKAHRQSFSESNRNLDEFVEDLDDDLEDDEEFQDNAEDDDDQEDEDEQDDDADHIKNEDYLDHGDDNINNNSDTSNGEKNSNTDESEVDEIDSDKPDDKNLVGDVDDAKTKDSTKSTNQRSEEVRKRKSRRTD